MRRMGSAFSAGTGNFQALKTAGSCDIANITFSGFNTSLNATDLLVSADGGVAKGSNRLIGLSYTYLDGSLPTGSIGYRHIDPMEALVARLAFHLWSHQPCGAASRSRGSVNRSRCDDRIFGRLHWHWEHTHHRG